MTPKLTARERGSQGYTVMDQKIQSSFIGHFPSLFIFIILFKYPHGWGNGHHSLHCIDEAPEAHKTKRSLSRSLYELLMAALTNDQKLSGFKHRLIVSQLWRSEVL